MNKLKNSLREALEAAGLRSGMTISFHHHLRNGDHVLNMVLEEAARMGIRDLTLQASSIFPVHAPLIGHIQSGVVTGIETCYLSGPVAEAVSHGLLQKPVLFRSHGGRAAAIAEGRVHIDIAFIAAPSADPAGNLNGVAGPAACGSLGYAFADARCADTVVAVTDNLVPYPLAPVSIDETQIDYVAKVDCIGDPRGIVSGTTSMTRDPVALRIADYAARAMAASGLMREGFSFQTGAGGASLAVTEYLKPLMRERGVTADFGMGGITGAMVELLEKGYIRQLLDVQCFDLKAVQSIRDNPNHIEIPAIRYAAPIKRGSAVDRLSCVVLGATEIDTDFNVNVHTDSSGGIIGGSGGHSDTAAGAALTLIVAPLFRARLPIVVDRAGCISTPGSTVDALVTQRGIAVHPRRADLKEALLHAHLPVYDIHDLQAMATRVTGVPDAPRQGDRVVGLVEYRDGSVIDRIYQQPG